jgi:hypothetical protein
MGSYIILIYILYALVHCCKCKISTGPFSKSRMTRFICADKNRCNVPVIPQKKENMATKSLKKIYSVHKLIQNSIIYALDETILIKRELKGYFSSDIESLLLRITAPTFLKPNQEDLDMFLSYTSTAVLNNDMESLSNTFRVILAKVWSKLTEKDPRTVLKAFFLLKLLLQKSSTLHANHFVKLIKQISKVKSLRSGSNFFDMAFVNANLSAQLRGTGTGSKRRKSLTKTTFSPTFGKFIAKYGTTVLNCKTADGNEFSNSRENEQVSYMRLIEDTRAAADEIIKEADLCPEKELVELCVDSLSTENQ